jgi:hypothetical protein
MSSKSGMSETRGAIHPERNFFSSCEPMKPDKLFVSKIQWWDKHRIDIPIPNGRNCMAR